MRYTSETFNTIVNNYTVMHNGEIARFYNLVAIIFRCFKNDVERLPLSRCSGNVDQWCILAVHGTCLPVGIRTIIVRIAYLNFIYSHNPHPAVTSSLAIAFDLRRSGKFDVQLATTKCLACLNRTGGCNFHEALPDLPLSIIAVCFLPRR